MMERPRCCKECLIKTGAFTGALMSVAVFCISLVVLISSIHNTRHFNFNETEATEVPQTTTELDKIASENSSDSIYVIPRPHENATVQAYSPLGDPSKEAREEEVDTIETTPKSLLPSVIVEEDKNVSASTPQPQPSPSSSSNTSSVYTSTEEVVDSDNDSLNNTNTSLVSTSPSSLNEAEAKPWNIFLERHQDLWKDKTDTYIILMQASSSVGIFAALLQLFFSFLLICGSSRKDLRDRTTLWNLSNFIVLILSIVIILLPFSYSNETDTFKRASVFWRDLHRVLMDSLELFSSKTLEILWNNFGNFLTKNFALYYYIVGMNSFILLAFLVPPLIFCLCLPCRKFCCKKKQYDVDTESDLMLFETGGDPFKY